ncbi:hypothetical protein ACHMW6_17305 [Pseudoduganella sp. UC29_106]|uniref:hypothetical protein n=1 Tax=Pseudoduganella sp. UC29_106 TaxID=3374553 RepID=UPI003757F70E
MEPNAIFPEPEAPVRAYLEWLGTASTKPGVFPLHDEVVIGRDKQDALGADQYLSSPSRPSAAVMPASGAAARAT